MTTKLLLLGLGAVAIYAIASKKGAGTGAPAYPGQYPSQSNGSGSVQTGSTASRIVDGIVRLGSEGISAYTTSQQNANAGPDGYLTPNWINGGSV